MKKWAIGITLTLVLAATVLYFIKQKQIKDYKLNFIPAKHETKQSILDYVTLNHIPGEILIAKDTSGYDNIFSLFAPGNIIVLDSNNKIVDCNFGNYNGTCYFDIAENIHNDFDFSESKYNHKILDSKLVNTLKTSTTFLTDFTWNDTVKNDYTVIYCWAKWMKSSHTNEGAVQKIADGIKNNKNRRVLLLSVNTDCVAPWYPITAELPN